MLADTSVLRGHAGTSKYDVALLLLSVPETLRLQGSNYKNECGIPEIDTWKKASAQVAQMESIATPAVSSEPEHMQYNLYHNTQ